MKLLQELSTLTEGRMKEAIMQLIDSAMYNFDFGNLTYAEAVKQLAKRVRAKDHNELVGGMTDAEIAELIEDQFPEEDLEDQKMSEALEDDSEFPKLLTKAGNFSVELDANEQVSILQNNDTKLSMPLVIWKQLVR